MATQISGERLVTCPNYLSLFRFKTSVIQFFIWGDFGCAHFLVFYLRVIPRMAFRRCISNTMSFRVAPAMRNHVSDVHVASGTKTNVHAYIQDITDLLLFPDGLSQSATCRRRETYLHYDICSATWYDAYASECEFFVDAYLIVSRGDDLTFGSV